MLFKKIPDSGTYADELYKGYKAFDYNTYANLISARCEQIYNAITPDYVRYDLFALAYAGYLAIDSTTAWRDKAKRAYERLNGFLGGTMVPLEDFITGGNSTSKHKYTHQGWNYPYEDLGVNNPLRWKYKKEIICSTIRRVFGLTDSEKIDSLGAILYYCHILADLRSNSTDEPQKTFCPILQ